MRKSVKIILHNSYTILVTQDPRCACKRDLVVVNARCLLQ